MLEAAQHARTFAAGRSRADLDSDLMLLMALVRVLEIIGEAAANVSDETRRVLDDLPWASITGMRHRLAHAYFDVSAEVVWATVHEDLPPLISRLALFLASRS